MKYKNFDDFFSSIDINKNEMIDNWENLKKRKKKITIITTIVMITIILSLFYLICYNTKLIRLIIPMFILFVIIITKLINTESKISKEIIKSNQEYKEKIIEKMLQNFIDELDYIPLKEMPSDIFDEANYGGYYNSYVSDDYFEGKINNQNIKIAESLTNYRYSFAIENNINEFYFTEKLLNCFASMKIPIYLGAEKIDKFFNKDGIIIIKEKDLENIDNIIDKCNKADYEDRKEAILDNFERVKKYLCVEDFLYETYPELFSR